MMRCSFAGVLFWQWLHVFYCAFRRNGVRIGLGDKQYFFSQGLGQAMYVSASDGPELKLEFRELARDVHRKTAGVVELTPKVMAGVELEVRVARVIGDLARSDRCGP